MASEYLNNRSFEEIICKFQRAKKQKVRYELIQEDLRETIRRKQKRKSDIGREKVNLAEAQEMYREVCFEHDTCQKQLATAFYTLSENIVRYAKFNLIDADDAIQEGVMICFEKVDRFDSRKGKAFNYMTTCVLNHFRQLYRTARNYNELKKKYHEFMELKMDVVVKNNRPIITGQNYLL